MKLALFLAISAYIVILLVWRMDIRSPYMAEPWGDL